MIQFAAVENSDVKEGRINEHHKPVMLNEVLQYLKPAEGMVVVDGTMGLGGHAAQILPYLGSSGRYIGIDQDQSSLETAKINLQHFETPITFIHENFRYVDRVLEELGVKNIDGMIFDLGLSSFQLDNPERGFSLRSDGPLDMRLDQNNPVCAYDLINSLSEKELINVLQNYGEERWSKMIARRLVNERNKNPLETTKQLRQLIMRAMPSGRARQKIHPATRTFQALRIAVNRELEALEEVIPKIIPYLKTGGRLLIISFHSLEDRIVKNMFKDFLKEEKLEILTKKPIVPTDQEIEENPRSRSAKLRVAEKI